MIWELFGGPKEKAYYTCKFINKIKTVVVADDSKVDILEDSRLD